MTVLFIFGVSAQTTDKADGKVQKLILLGAKKQLKIKTIYKNRYLKIPYPNGDVPESEGVCTDVIIRAYRNADIDIQKLLHEDRIKHPEDYPTDLWENKDADSNIDHRRCPNLFAFLKKFGKEKTLKTDEKSLKEWKGGDVIFYNKDNKPWHVGIVSDRINRSKGFPFIIDNYPEPGYTSETHVITDFDEISGHFRYP